MTDDVEQTVRRALRADAELITRESLRYAGLRTPQRTHRVRVLVTASLATVAIIGVTVVAADNWRGQGAHGGPTGAAGLPVVGDPFDGTRWKLTGVKHEGQDTPVPASWDATVEFSGGRISMNDTGNAIGGPYTRTPVGFTVSDQAITDRLVVSSDPVRTLVMQAIDAISFGGPSQANVGVVTATVDRDSMVLSVQGFTLTFNRDGQARVYVSATPTNSNTATSSATSASPSTVSAAAVCAAAISQPIAASSLTTVGEIRGWERGGPGSLTPDPSRRPARNAFVGQDPGSPAAWCTVGSGGDYTFYGAGTDGTAVQLEGVGGLTGATPSEPIAIP